MGNFTTALDKVVVTGMQAAFQELVHQVSIEKYNKEGVPVEFSVARLQKLSDLYSLMAFLNTNALDDKIMGVLLREFVIHAQQYVIQPNVYDTSHNYRTWTDMTDESYYARSLPEIESQYTVPMSDEEKKKIVDEWVKKYPRLGINENDSPQVKKDKQKTLDQLPHSVKVGEEVFTRKEFLGDQSTSFFLGCFAQWFVEQAFKTGTDTHARTGIEEMKESEFKRQWGKNKIDMSNLYGENEDITTALRLMKGGKLKSQWTKVGDYMCEFPPKLTFKTENIADDEVSQSDVKMFYPKDWTKEQAEERLYALGHPRFNLHFGLCFITTLWLREHNLTAQMLEDAHKDDPEWDDERIFQTTRLIMIIELMKVVMEDYIKHIMTYKFTLKYDPEVLFNTKFQYHERAHYEFNYLYRWHAMCPTQMVVGGKMRDYGSEIQWNPKFVSDFGMLQLYKDVSAQNIGQLGLNNTPEFLKFLDITTLCHSRVLKTKSYVDYREEFEGTQIKDFSEISSDKAIQEQLQKIYGSVENIDYYVGLLAEDLLPHGPTGTLMQTQLGIYAFSAIYSNPLNSPHLYNETTFTKEGFARAKDTTLAKLLNRNLQEAGAVYGKPVAVIPEDGKFDLFAPSNGQYSLPQNNNNKEKDQRNKSIQQEIKKWPLNEKGTHVPMHPDDSRAHGVWVVEALMMDHSTVMAKNQLRGIVEAVMTSTKIPGGFLSTFKTQLEIIHSILSSKNKGLTESDTRSLIQHLNHFNFWSHDPDTQIDTHFGVISKSFSNFQSDHLQNFNWNKDEVFGDTIMNGLDPTQLHVFDGDLLAKGKAFESFADPSVAFYFKGRFGLKMEDAIKAGHVMALDSFDVMSLCTTNPINIARPRSLFYYDIGTKKLFPFAIQLNSLNSLHLKVHVENAEGLKRRGHIIAGDPYVKVRIGETQHTTSTKFKTNNPTWNEAFDFNIFAENDVMDIELHDKNWIWFDKELGQTSIKISDLKVGKNTLTLPMCNGFVNMIVEKDEFDHKYEQRVFLPTHNAWTLAKFFVGNAYVVVHEIVSHNLFCHSLMELVKLSLHRNVFRKHPIFGILSPHLYYTDIINLLARKTLLKDDGSGLVSVLFSCGIDAYKINDAAWKKFDFTKYVFPESSKLRGNSLPTYWFKQDGERVWTAIEKYVVTTLKTFYTEGDKSVLEDYELASFVQTLKTYMPGMIEVTTFSSLVYLLTSLIFNGSAMHTALHWSQLDQLSFAPLLPTILNRAPPRFEDQTFGPVKDGHTLTGDQQSICMQYLPTIGQAIMINATFAPVTQKTDKPLIDEKYNPFVSGPGFDAFNEFQKTLNQISQEIQKRGSYAYLSSNSRSINF